jgi:hypothetical protein
MPHRAPLENHHVAAGWSVAIRSDNDIFATMPL